MRARGKAMNQSFGGAGNNVARDFGGGNPGGGGGGGGDFDRYTYTHVERAPGVGQKLGNSLAGLMLGPILVFLGCLLLWYNEGNAIKVHRSLNEAMDAYQQIHDASKPPSGELNNALVHMTDRVSVDSPASDSLFGLKRRDTVSISRQVEIYQWVQNTKKKKHKKSNGDTVVETSYEYKKNWKGSPVDSSNFVHHDGHQNYGNMPFSSKTFHADGIHLGAYALGDTFLNQISWSSPLSVNEATKIPGGGRLQGNYIYFPENGGQKEVPKLSSGERDLNKEIEMSIVSIDGEDKIMYTVVSTGKSFSKKDRALEAAAKAPTAARSDQYNEVVEGPGIGDVRVTFTETRAGIVSILGKLAGKFVTKWPSKQGTGYDVGILAQGSRSAEEMISSAQSSNATFTWFKRAGGWLLNFIGFAMLTQIVSTTADITLNWIPFLGPMALSIINLGVTLANIILASTLSTIVTAIAWVFYRPILGASLLVGSLGIFYTASQAGKKVMGEKVV